MGMLLVRLSVGSKIDPWLKAFPLGTLARLAVALWIGMAETRLENGPTAVREAEAAVWCWASKRSSAQRCSPLTIFAARTQTVDRDGAETAQAWHDNSGGLLHLGLVFDFLVCSLPKGQVTRHQPSDTFPCPPSTRSADMPVATSSLSRGDTAAGTSTWALDPKTLVAACCRRYWTESGLFLFDQHQSRQDSGRTASRRMARLG